MEHGGKQTVEMKTDRQTDRQTDRRRERERERERNNEREDCRSIPRCVVGYCQLVCAHTSAQIIIPKKNVTSLDFKFP
jgi:hypothetical protein